MNGNEARFNPIHTTYTISTLHVILVLQTEIHTHKVGNQCTLYIQKKYNYIHSTAVPIAKCWLAKFNSQPDHQPM